VHDAGWTGRTEVKRGVLVVDDDPFIRKLISTTLEDVSEFQLYEAADGVQAVEVAERELPTIVFLDVDMPRMDGIDTCRRLRNNPATSGATIVILTAAHGDGIEAQAEAAGADLFLTKPFSPLDLLRLVDRLGAQSDRIDPH
jgi:two-component system chemotaxis response regulator CheY